MTSVYGSPSGLARAAPSRSGQSGLAAYYDRQMALLQGVAFAWTGRQEPVAVAEGITQVGVSREACFALREDHALITWRDSPSQARTLAHDIVRFAAGESGWFAIDRADTLWQGSADGAPPRPVAHGVDSACIGDSADYYIDRSGRLFVRGLAHRGQYGDGRLSASEHFVNTANEVIAVAAHTGHAIHLRRDGVVMGTGGNRFGPLSSHGLGDKADRWGPIFEGAVAIATGSRHSLALRADGGLWAWGEGFAIAPARIAEAVQLIAAGDTVSLALGRDGSL